MAGFIAMATVAHISCIAVLRNMYWFYLWIVAIKKASNNLSEAFLCLNESIIAF